MRNKMTENYKDEGSVNNWVAKKLEALGLKDGNGHHQFDVGHFNHESGYSQYMKAALKGSAKTLKIIGFMN